MASNFQFSLYLKESGLSEAERYNLERIFNALRPERQMEIIDSWPIYLDKILEIKHHTEQERQKSIKEAFSRIEKLIDDAYLREQEAKRRAVADAGIRESNRKGSEDYERAKKLEALKRIGRENEEKPKGDPLADFL